MRSLAPEAIEVLRRALKDKRHRLHAAESVLNRAYGKPKETLQLDQDAPRMLVVPDSVFKAGEAMRTKREMYPAKIL